MKQDDAQYAAFEAARWWSKQIESPTFDNGADDYGNLFAQGIAAAVTSSAPPTRREIDLFCARLTRSILAEMGKTRWHLTIGVDYGADPILTEAAQFAGLPINRFPWKTLQMVESDHVIAALGYGSPFTLIWATKEWRDNRPLCRSPDYGPDGMIRSNFICGMPRYHDGSGHGLWRENPLRCTECGGTMYDHYREGGITHQYGSQGGDYHPWRPNGEWR